EEVDSPADGGAVSMAPVEVSEPAAAPGVEAVPEPAERELDWAPMELEEGTFSISCELDYTAGGDGEPVATPGREELVAAMTPCAERGVMRLRYEGRLTAEFTALIERVIEVADELHIDKRVLDID